MLQLYNTLVRKKQPFLSIKPKRVGLYACGPTVYWYPHLGNLRAYLFEDILRRTLEYNGYRVRHVINITDVGHLTSDADTGEDKMEKGAQREKKSVWAIAQYYTNIFQEDLKKLNIKNPSFWTKATDYIKEQIDLIKILEKKGFTYLIEDGLYFDTTKINNYGILWGKKKMLIKAGARVEMVKGKRNPSDFALWKLTPPTVERQMEWDSPWGKGFPGWHTECVAMAKAKLGIPFDIHCGGIDHIQTHHTNEIAQVQAAYGKTLSQFWLHGNFLNIKGGKMAKSAGKILRIKTLEEKGFNPLAYRYLCLSAHYRSPLSFFWQSLSAAQKGLDSLIAAIADLNQKDKITKVKVEKEKKIFLSLINDDLDTPKSLAFLRKLLKRKDLNLSEKLFLVKEFDKIFGLNLIKKKKATLSKEVKELIEQRNRYREAKEWSKADQIREKIEKLGYHLEDRNKKTIVK